MLTFLEVGFAANLVQGFRAYASRAVLSFPQIALCFPSFALRPQPLCRLFWLSLVWCALCSQDWVLPLWKPASPQFQTFRPLPRNSHRSRLSTSEWCERPWDTYLSWSFHFNPIWSKSDALAHESSQFQCDRNINRVPYIPFLGEEYLDNFQW